MITQTLQQQDQQNKKTNYRFISDVHCVDRNLLLLQKVDAEIENENVKMSTQQIVKQV